MAQARQPPDTRPFLQLSVAEGNMDFLTNLFHKGLGGLDSVLWQFQHITAQCVYVFHLQIAELALVYVDPQKQHASALGHAQ
eukprot:5612328-Pleurochrysis_carterae.AAC.1